MQEGKKTIMLIISSSMSIIAILYVIYAAFLSTPEVIYVDNVKLFDGFYMTKEMKKIGEKEFNTRKMILDSLYSKLQSDSVSEIEKKLMMQQFIKGKEELEQFNQNFAGEESLKIWSRIHSYVDEYSKETNYKLIIGSQNKETVLFASEKIDKTNELLAYINKKYEGIK